MLKKLLTVFAVALLTFASYVAAVELRDDHPDTYTVQRGDTLWDIAGRFLNEPWLWPEIWQANPQIENPHLIYPGDVISLAYLGGRPTLSVTRRQPEVRRSRADAITTIPLSDIEAFLRSARVLDEDEFQNLPYVLAPEEDRLRATSGQVVYVRGANFEPGQRWAVVRPSVRFAKLLNPDTNEARLKTDAWNSRDGLYPGSDVRWAYYAAFDKDFEVLGWEVIDVTAGQVTVGGDPATLLLDPEGREVREGDLLMPVEAQRYDLTFHPRAPGSVPSNMRVLAVTDFHRYGGPRDVVALSAGSREGVEVGEVFSLYAEGNRVRDEIAHGSGIRSRLKGNQVQLPDEFGGHVMIFRTFDKVSYGLVMDGIRPVKVGDTAKAPVRL